MKTPRPAILLKNSTCWPAEGISGLTGDETCLMLTRGFVSLIDAEDAIDLQQFNWCAMVMLRDRQVAAVRRYGDYSTLLLHRQIMNPPQDRYVDHVDQHRFYVFKIVDNRRANLRVVTNSQNQANRRKTKGSSIYKGVSWRACVKKWRPQISLDGRRKHLGLFDSEIEAANAYDAAHAQIHPGIPEGTNAAMMIQQPS